MAIVTGTFNHASSIDPIGDLFVRYAYDDANTDMPVLVAMHGYQQDAAGFPQEVIDRFATAGVFVIVPGMRGRDGASGSKDSCGRELADIVDAVTHARATFPTLCSATRAAIVGYSGGGGNALAVACKYPDFWTNVASHFGMSDFSTWYSEYSSPAVIAAWVGGAPADVPERYAARNAQTAILNFTGGKLYLFHDAGDTAVWLRQSQLVSDLLTAAGRSNFLASYTTEADAARWLHGYPVAAQSPDLYLTEAEWLADVAAETQAVWEIPETGTLKCIGYLVTKRFAVWLEDGTEHTADVTYTSNTVHVVPSATCQVTVMDLTGHQTTQMVTPAGADFGLIVTVADFQMKRLLAAPLAAFQMLRHLVIPVWAVFPMARTLVETRVLFPLSRSLFNVPGPGYNGQLLTVVESDTNGRMVERVSDDPIHGVACEGPERGVVLNDSPEG